MHYLRRPVAVIKSGIIAKKFLCYIKLSYVEEISSIVIIKCLEHQSHKIGDAERYIVFQNQECKIDYACRLLVLETCSMAVMDSVWNKKMQACFPVTEILLNVQFKYVDLKIFCLSLLTLHLKIITACMHSCMMGHIPIFANWSAFLLLLCRSISW